ncbi:hypothetical protein ABT186_26020 [Streptomyces sp. NPDC001634]|uniref:hypothetical protein n=1 Tax=Streptomyces sp. NPDC001634 TaxID=3154390 RepID=UPI003332D464
MNACLADGTESGHGLLLSRYIQGIGAQRTPESQLQPGSGFGFGSVALAAVSVPGTGPSGAARRRATPSPSLSRSPIPVSISVACCSFQWSAWQDLELDVDQGQRTAPGKWLIKDR